MTESMASHKGDGESRAAVRQVHRTKRIHVSNVAEIGALVRLRDYEEFRLITGVERH